MELRFQQLTKINRIVVFLTIVTLGLLLIGGLYFFSQSENVNERIQEEDGILEYLTALFFMAAGVIFLHAMVSKGSNVREPFKDYRLVLILLGILCLFAGLEEISFGQRIVGWDSPEYFEDNSSQEETDFHNFEGLSIVFGVAAIALILYGVIVPYGFWKMPNRFVWFRKPFGIRMIYPPMQSAVFLAIGIVLIFIDVGTKYITGDQFVANEYQEYFFGYGFLLFSMYLYHPEYQKIYRK